MGDVLKVPEDLKSLYEASSQPLMVGADSAWRGEAKKLIERIARAEQRVEEQEYFLHLSEAQHRSALDRCDSLEAENAALQREIAALRAPISEEEWQPLHMSVKFHASGRLRANALIAARASAQGGKGNGNG